MGGMGRRTYDGRSGGSYVREGFFFRGGGFYDGRGEVTLYGALFSCLAFQYDTCEALKG